MPYSKTTWHVGDVITEEKLNKIETQVAKVTTNLENMATGGEVIIEGGMTEEEEARLQAVEAALENKVDKVIDNTEYRPFGLFYANYGGPYIRDSIEQSAATIAKYSICVFSYLPNLESSCPASHIQIMQRAKELNPQIKFYNYITASSSHDDYTLNEDGSWENSPAAQAGVERIYNRHELIQFFHDLHHVGGTRTGQYDSEGCKTLSRWQGYSG